jgi:hypothetical protein
MIPITDIVRKYAIGSLLPLSNSRVARIFFLSPIFFDLNTAKTAAASVDDTIDPRSNPSKNVKSVIAQTKIPTTWSKNP